MIGRDIKGPFHGAVRRTATCVAPVLVRRRPLARHQGLVSGGGRVLLAALGETGLAALKREGDRATPRLRLRPFAGLSRRRGAMAVPSRAVGASDGWCDDPASQQYNRLVALPARDGHERLLREDGIYDHILLTSHNRFPRVRGAGSAIFIHVARPALTGTYGCIAFSAKTWRHGLVPVGDYLIGIEPRPKRSQ